MIEHSYSAMDFTTSVMLDVAHLSNREQTAAFTTVLLDHFTTESRG
jgi:hypothetical protein